MKSPERDLTTTLPSAENGSTGLHFGVSHYRRTSLKGPPTTFHTVSLLDFSHSGRVTHRVSKASYEGLRLFACRFPATTRKKDRPKAPAEVLAEAL